MKICKIKMIWEDGIWHTEAEEGVGLVLESGSFDALVERVRMALPEMLELNFGYSGPVQIVFETERIDVLGAA
ncbi:MAG: DUF1902 domain-containing protein [Clostridiales bacterium]|jgi:hypothetical protein|nr:DUF1902 domain-containing protein [Clostridiales bacterium]